MVPQTYFSRSRLNTVRDSFYFVTADRLGSAQICRSLSFPKCEHGMHMGESPCFCVRHLLIPNNRVQTLLLLDVYSFDTFSTFPSHSYRMNLLFIYCMILENGSDFCLLPSFKSVCGKIKYKQHFYGSDDCNFLYEKQRLSFDAASRAQALTEGNLMKPSQRPPSCLFHGLELDVFVSSQVW